MKSLRSLALLLALLPAWALAHPGTGASAHHALIQGLIHPFTGTDHLAAMLAVGFWTALAARRGRADLVLAPLTIGALLATGALLTHAGLTLPLVEPMVAASLLVLGLLLANQACCPLPWILPLVGAFSLFHGAAHGTALTEMAALVGALLGSAMLFAVGLVAGLVVRHRNAWIPRAAGAAVGLLGATMLLGLVR